MTVPAHRKWFAQVFATDEARVDAALLHPDTPLIAVDPTWPINGESPWSVRVEAADVGCARAQAVEALAPINCKLAEDTPLHEPLRVGVIWQADAKLPGGHSRAVFVDVGPAALTLGALTVNASAATEGIAAPPPRTLGLRLRELAAENGDFAEAQRMLASSTDDIRGLHLVLEYVRKRSGFKPERFAPKAEIAAFAETANERFNHRHIGGDKPLHYPEVAPQQATKLMRRLLLGWLTAAKPH